MLQVQQGGPHRQRLYRGDGAAHLLQVREGRPSAQGLQLEVKKRVSPVAVTLEQSSEVHTPLKGAIDKGGSKSGGQPDLTAGKTQTGQVILRLSAMRKIDRDTRLVLLRGYLRNAQSG